MHRPMAPKQMRPWAKLGSALGLNLNTTILDGGGQTLS
jgi:hypothetical protein